MSDTPRYRLVLAKEDFKFSVAHFTLFSGTRAELLHGHNYQVSLELTGREVDEWGLLADVEGVKQAVRGLCRRLDSHTLLPERSPALAWSRDDGQELGELRLWIEDGRITRAEDRHLVLAAELPTPPRLERIERLRARASADPARSQ